MSDSFMLRSTDQAQQALSAVLDQGVDSIKLMNLEGTIEFVNPAGLDAFAVADLAPVAGNDWASLWPEETQPRVREAVARAARGQTDRFEGYCPARDGRPLWWEVNVSPVRNAAGATTHVLASARDVTARVQERRDDRQRRDRAERAAKRADGVAREMRHRLKNQLAVVAAVARLLARHASDAPDLGRRLDDRLQALARAQDLLTLHRSEPLGARLAITQVLEASSAGERVTLGPIPDVRLGDQAIQQLALILGELQTNSLKYGALRYGEGTILLTGTAKDGLLTLCWHEDTGRPVSPPEGQGAGFVLVTRLGSAAEARGQIRWHATGPTVEFHLRTREIPRRRRG